MRTVFTALGKLPQWFILFIAQAAWFLLSLPFRLLSPALQFAILGFVTLIGYESLPELPRESLRQHAILPARDFLAHWWARLVWVFETSSLAPGPETAPTTTVPAANTTPSSAPPSREQEHATTDPVPLQAGPQRAASPLSHEQIGARIRAAQEWQQQMAEAQPDAGGHR